jgi:hypothetical protein
MRALPAKHNIRIAATQLDGDRAIGLMDALSLRGPTRSGWPPSAGCSRRRDRL